MERVLVLGDDPRSTLAVIRSLGRVGVKVDLGTNDENNISKYSRYIKRVFLLPNVYLHIQEWLQALRRLCVINMYDLVIPLHDHYILPLVKYRKEFESIVKLAIPDDFAFEFTFNKYKTIELAKSLGVPIPKSIYVDSINKVEDVVQEVKNNLSLPVYVKPVSSVIWKDNRIFGRLSVRFVQDENQLYYTLQDMLKITPVLVQKYTLGKTVGQEFLCSNGEIYVAFQHERVHQPLYGGGSSYRKSAELDPVLFEYSHRLLAWLKWTGVVMIEYKVNERTGEKYLIEINGRFWGSLPLSIVSGVDFPRLLYEMYVKQHLQPVTVYKTGLYCRNIGMDMTWLFGNLKVLKTKHANPYLYTLPPSQIFKELANILSGKERFDTFTIDDLLPGFMEIYYLIDNMLKIARRKIKNSLLMSIRRTIIGKQVVYRKRKEITHKILQKPYILFVCSGNIIRGPFAKYYMEKVLEEKGLYGFFVESAGLNAASSFSLQSPILAVEATKKFGVDLSKHRSKRITRKIMHESGVIFVMDWENYEHILRLFGARDKVFLLGIFGDRAPIEIPDPIGGELPQYVESFNYIAECINNLTAMLKHELKINQFHKPGRIRYQS